MDMCACMRIPVESLHAERGAGLMEAALRHGHTVEIADNAVLFKTFAKVVAQRRRMLMTFMARWSNEADGQSGHIHFSLTDGCRNPVFYDGKMPDGISATMRHFIGGMQRLMGDFLLMFAPNVNSYKRLVPGFFAPTSADWGIENRTCAIRAIPGPPKATRVECRTPGADANPYLSIAAVLAAGLYGIEHAIEPSAPSDNNVYAAEVPEELRLPADFATAIKRFRQSPHARDYFGDTFVEAYADTRAAQLAQFNTFVTDRELGRFFELV
jgi:glutamine synthetase